MIKLTSFEKSPYQRERDIIHHLAKILDMLGGDDKSGLDTCANWLQRIKDKINTLQNKQ